MEAAIILSKYIKYTSIKTLLKFNTMSLYVQINLIVVDGHYEISFD